MAGRDSRRKVDATEMMELSNCLDRVQHRTLDFGIDCLDDDAVRDALFCHPFLTLSFTPTAPESLLDASRNNDVIRNRQSTVCPLFPLSIRPLSPSLISFDLPPYERNRSAVLLPDKTYDFEDVNKESRLAKVRW